MPAETQKKRNIASLVSEFGIVIALLIEILFFAILSPYFFTADNLLNVSLQASITAIIAAGMTFVILTGGIDLSVGSLVAFAGIVSTTVLKTGLPPAAGFAAAILAGVAVGSLSGAFAGFCITRFNIAPFIVTLATMTIWRGAAFVWTDGRPVWELPAGFDFLGTGRLLAVPVPTIIMVLAFVASHVI